jgi:hypothetical protein
MWFVRARCGSFDEPFVGMGKNPDEAYADLETQCTPNPDYLEWFKGTPAKVKVTTAITIEAE